ncbi:hypothetical protein [Streptomyces bluensis]|uniref:hypothetical protein n=1 Tax=Streptomyces bluensis TaxID=33897 RepID=UPI0016741414|nr:hypothetical protein [Streptomyces bluensis]GGZ70126.1 hypothetical protein GCM10010344_41390 [Streptomyces bluensis]
MTDTTLQSVPQVLLDPFTGGPVLTRTEAACLAAALTPSTRPELEEAGFTEDLVDGMLKRGLLAPAPADAALWHRHGRGRPQALLHAADAHRATRVAELPARPGVLCCARGPICGCTSPSRTSRGSNAACTPTTRAPWTCAPPGCTTPV